MDGVDWAAWRPSEPYTVGIEEEIMLLDPVSWSLTQRGDEVLSLAAPDLAGRCAAETHDAALELRTAPHATVREAIAELRDLRSLLMRDLTTMGIAAAACGMHPAPMTEPAKVSPSSRYQVIHRTTRDLARREPTFALHVHVGLPDEHSAIRLVNQLRAHLPLLLALSASSPMLRGREPAWPPTGRSCSRASRAPGSRGASIATGTGSRPSTCSSVRERSRSRRSCGGTSGRSLAWEPLR